MDVAAINPGRQVSQPAVLPGAKIEVGVCWPSVQSRDGHEGSPPSHLERGRHLAHAALRPSNDPQSHTFKAHSRLIREPEDNLCSFGAKGM